MGKRRLKKIDGAQDLPLTIKKSKIRVKIWSVMKYRDCPVYLRQIGLSYFEWLVIFQNELYSGYIEMQPAKDKKKLTDEEIRKTVNLVLAGATTTIDSFYFREEEAQKELDTEKKGQSNDA